MRDLVNVAAALSDENRVRALAVLNQGELCVCQLIELLQLAPSTVSKHMSILRQAGLVDSRKDGRWAYYFLPDAKSESSAVAKEAVKWAIRSLGDGAQITADRKRIAAIKCESPEDLCRRQLCKTDSACCSSAPATPVAARWQKDSPRRLRATSSKPTRPARARTA